MVRAKFTRTRTYIVPMNIVTKRPQGLLAAEAMHGVVGQSVRICDHAASRQ